MGRGRLCAFSSLVILVRNCNIHALLRELCYHGNKGEYAMRIEKFSLSGYRVFKEKQEITLHPRMNVIFGENGTGKSTLLSAMMISLSWVPARIKSISGNGNLIATEDINTYSPSAQFIVECRSGGNPSIEWSLHRTKKGYPSRGKSEYSSLNAYAKSMQSQIEITGENCNLPLVGFYPVNRAWIEFPSRIRTHHEFSLTSILESVENWNASYKVLYEWFQNQSHIESMEKVVSGKGYVEPSLEAVRRAVYAFMPGFTNLIFKPKTPRGLFIDKSGGGSFSIEQLSGGEQCLLAMIGDLARKLTIANPKLDNPLEGEGVVFIDEIDLHLHPSWQYTIIDSLKRTFPNCQFILTTHSPFVLSNMKPEEVISLSYDDDRTIRLSKGVHSYGKDAEAIYEDYMKLNSTRPERVSAKIREIYKELDVDLSKAEAELKALQSEVVGDDELQKIQLIIDRKRLLGR
jgi:predicted ATP-binding protein involved in virulence